MSIKDKILDLSNKMQGELVTIRRDFHKHAESAWTEFRTASIVAEYLENLGYKVLIGDEVMVESAMMGVPSAEVLEKHMERAKEQGARVKFLDKMKGGKTGVVAVLETGRPGPVIALRFDMDANDLDETKDANHFPNKEGFASINKDAMHACGHDGHTAVGMGVAKALMELKDEFNGTIKLVFQPAEEGVRGAACMVEKGIADDVNYMLGMHIWGTPGQFVCGVDGMLATSKFDAYFKGVPTHAGVSPEKGKSALLAACAATMAMQGIYRHSAGVSRINIGVLNAGTGRNVVPEHAVVKLETRGETSEIDAFVRDEALRMIKASAEMYDVEYEVKAVGGAMSGTSDEELVALAREVATELAIFDDIKDRRELGGSEDFSYFMERVQSKGGKACYVMVGSKCAAGPHNGAFDFEESALSQAVAAMLHMTHKLAK